MERISCYASSCPFIKSISQKTNIDPAYIAIGCFVLLLLITQTTPAGSIVSNLISIAIVLRDSLLNLGTHCPKQSQLRKNNIVLCLLLLFIAIEILFLSCIIPFFPLVKIGAVLWGTCNEKNAEFFYNNLFAHIPALYLQSGKGIDDALKNTAKKLESEINKIKLDKKAD